MLKVIPHYNIPTDKEIAEKARTLILSDLSIYDPIPELALKTGTNSFKLKNVFKKYYGVSIFQFSRQERMEKAKVLLSETNYTIQTIGEMVGYSEGNNFQVAFKAVVGKTPGEWRRSPLNPPKGESLQTA
jgi:AraC-like DNA-binding protein